MRLFGIVARIVVAGALVLGSGKVSEAATFTVTHSQPEGEGSLAWAVAQANANRGPDAIVFAPGCPSPIALEDSLEIRDTLTIDGGKTVVIAMATTGTAATLLQFLVGSNGSVIKDLALVNAHGGCYLASDNNRMIGCAVGTDWGDAEDIGNAIGVRVSGRNNTIGGSDPADRNVISGNSQYGILVQVRGQCRIQGNFIGTDSSGSKALPNALGVRLTQEASGCLVGGARGTGESLGEGNLITGNTNGVQIDGFTATGNTICGNLIGLTLAQTGTLPGDNGVILNNTAGNWVGLPESGKENIVCGQRAAGIAIDGTPPSRSNVVQNNLVGVNPAGSRFPNRIGVMLHGDTNRVGVYDHPGDLERNVISGNTDVGIQIRGDGNVVCGNHVGIAPNETQSLANRCGIQIRRGLGNLIGGTAPGQGNFITGSEAGVALTGADTAGNTVVGNWIGLLPGGDSPSRRQLVGVSITADANHNWVGLPGTGQGNLIANSELGIALIGNSTVANGLFGNTVSAFWQAGIHLEEQANRGKAAPHILAITADSVAGTAQAGDLVEVFRAEPWPNRQGGSLVYLGSTYADASGAWRVPPAGLTARDYACALATDAGNNTSEFSINYPVSGPPPATMTVTATPTITPTPVMFQSADAPLGLRIAPNPGRDLVTLRFHLNQAGEVEATAYNMYGERVAVVRERLEAGDRQIAWVTRELASGIYIVRLRKDGEEIAKTKIAIVH